MSGGGGGDGGAADRARAEQERKTKATNTINTYFGIGGTPVANANLSKLNSMYDQTQADTRAYFNNQNNLNQQRAARELGFQLARQGQVGGSLQNDQETMLNDQYQQGQREVEAKALASRNNLVSSDEQARNAIIDRITAGLDEGSAVNSAINMQKNNAATALDTAKGEALSNVFDQVSGLWNRNVANQAAQQAAVDPRLATYFNTTRKTNTGTSGNVAGSY